MLPRKVHRSIGRHAALRTSQKTPSARRDSARIQSGPTLQSTLMVSNYLAETLPHTALLSSGHATTTQLFASQIAPCSCQVVPYAKAPRRKKLHRKEFALAWTGRNVLPCLRQISDLEPALEPTADWPKQAGPVSLPRAISRHERARPSRMPSPLGRLSWPWTASLA